MKMPVNTMVDSDNIWQWCNARKKMYHQRSAAAATVGDDALSTRVVPLKGQEEMKYPKKKAERYAAFSCHDPLSLSSYESIGESTKFSDRQSLPDPVEQPTTPDLDDPVSKTRKLELSKLHGIASPCFSYSVCGQTSADSSSSTSIVHDEAAEDGMHLQSMDFSSQPSCNNNNPNLEHMALVPKSPKIESYVLKKDRNLISRMPTRGFRRNLRPQAKSKVSSDGLDLLVKAIFLLENWGNKSFPAHQQCKVGLAFIDTGLQKKRVIRRAKSAYKHRRENEKAEQMNNRIEADSKPDLQGNLVSELGIAPMAEPNKKQLDQHQAEALQSHFMIRLRRSVRSTRGN